MKTALFDYRLPRELVAQHPACPRDNARFLVYTRATGTVRHRRFFELSRLLRRGDVLVLNDTKVFKARLFGYLLGSNRTVEVFLLRRMHGRQWEALGKPGKKFISGNRIVFHTSSGKGARLECRILHKYPDGRLCLAFNRDAHGVIRVANRIGHIPVPPYIGREPKDFAEYQTIFARRTGSVAAPTAALHFTPRLIKAIKKRGVVLVRLTLHVGLGTFRPIKTTSIEAHQMHPEWVRITKGAAEIINRAKKEGRRVIAVGTTVVRALEAVAQETQNAKRKTQNHGIIHSYNGTVDIFITPGFKFKIVDALITNFHLPRSTLMVLVSAFIGSRTRALRAYKEAIREKYRFYSFGDAMFIE